MTSLGIPFLIGCCDLERARRLGLLRLLGTGEAEGGGGYYCLPLYDMTYSALRASTNAVSAFSIDVLRVCFDRIMPPGSKTFY